LKPLLISYQIRRIIEIIIHGNDNRLINEIRNETDLLMTYVEADDLFKIVGISNKIGGDIAEVGVYKGGSAKIICERKGNKILHLFDTFEGMPEACKKDGEGHPEMGRLTSRLDEVKEYLKGYPNVYFYKGVFPETAKSIKERTFSLVHLDVDLYQSTYDSLVFFYPRMTRGGVIISHDYHCEDGGFPGVRKAVDEFFIDKPEIIIELSGTECVIIKL
jgi:hypothetical protein